MPRRHNQASIGPGTAPEDFRTKWMSSASLSSLSTSTPPMMSEWPFRYFVDECMLTSAPEGERLLVER